MWQPEDKRGDWLERLFVEMSGMNLFLLILLILIILAALPAWPYSRAWGYLPSVILAGILLIVVIALLMY